MAEQPKIHESWEPILKKHELRPQGGEASFEHREAMRHAVRERVEHARRNLGVVPPPRAPVTTPVQDIHPKEKELTGLDETRQATFLAHLAVEEGIEPAVRIAEKLGSPYVIDALHDFITDKLLDALLRRKDAR